jgi:hypothetical protein
MYPGPISVIHSDANSSCKQRAPLSAKLNHSTEYKLTMVAISATQELLRAGLPAARTWPVLAYFSMARAADPAPNVLSVRQ